MDLAATGHAVKRGRHFSGMDNAELASRMSELKEMEPVVAQMCAQTPKGMSSPSSVSVASAQMAKSHQTEELAEKRDAAGMQSATAVAAEHVPFTPGQSEGSAQQMPVELRRSS